MTSAVSRLVAFAAFAALLASAPCVRLDRV